MLRRTIVPPRAVCRSDPGWTTSTPGPLRATPFPPPFPDPDGRAAVGRHAEERALGFGGQKHPAVERHKRRVARGRAGMNGPRDEAAAGAGLAGQHDADGRGGGLGHLTEDLAHGLGLGHEPQGQQCVVLDHGVNRASPCDLQGGAALLKPG